jgi:hypothetical protein
MARPISVTTAAGMSICRSSPWRQRQRSEAGLRRPPWMHTRHSTSFSCSKISNLVFI